MPLSHGPTRLPAFQTRRHHTRGEAWSAAERVLAVQTFVLLVFSAWAGGGRMPWAPPAMLAIAGCGVIVLFLRRSEGESVRLRALVPLALWLVLLAIALLNPSHVDDSTGVRAPNLRWISWLPATVDPGATLVAELPWLTALLQGGVLVAARPGRRLVRFIWGAAALNGFALAAVGAAFHFAEANMMLGFIEVPEPTYFFATFFYKNHWVAYGALSAAAGAAVALQSWRQALLGDPRARGRAILFGTTSLLTAITLPLPRSRTGGLLAIALIVGFFAVLLAMLAQNRGVSRGRRVAVIGLLSLLVLAASGYGFNAYLPRAREDWKRTVIQVENARRGESLELRLLLSRDTWRMAAARPWFGWGIGSFEVTFPIFQGDYLRGPDGRTNARVEFAHNDWLQMAAEAGLAGLAVLLVPIMGAARRAWREGGIGGRWGLAGCGAIAVFAWIDFPFNNPSVLVLWTTLLLTARHLGAKSEAASAP